MPISFRRSVLQPRFHCEETKHEPTAVLKHFHIRLPYTETLVLASLMLYLLWQFHLRFVFGLARASSLYTGICTASPALVYHG